MMSDNPLDELSSDLWAARWIRSGLGQLDRSARAHAILLGAGPHPLSLLRSLVASERIRRVEEPLDRGRGVELLFALVQLYVHRPEAIVLVVPDSCRLRRSEASRDRLARAYLRALRCPDAVITVGRSPQTAITVARARALLDRYARSLPRLLRLFCFHASLPAAEQDRFLEESYRRLPAVGLDPALRPAGRICALPRHSVAMLRPQSGPGEAPRVLPLAP